MKSYGVPFGLEGGGLAPVKLIGEPLREADAVIIQLYALYLLSRCNGFLASSMCNGVFIVRAFNEGRFECDDSARELILKGRLAEVE